MVERRLAKIRLPLQIGTSALWSLARVSAIFPGIIVGVAGCAAGIALLRGDSDSFKVAFSTAIVGLVTGGCLIYYAVRHAKLALEERPSDVVLDADGLRIEGGERDGLALAWTDVDPSRCEITDEHESRLILWRVIANLPLLALSLAAEQGILLDYTRKVPVQRLWVARRGDGERVLVAEADIAIERESLEALAATIRSSRWYGGAAAAPAGPAAIACPTCSAAIAPSAAVAVACGFCGQSVPIPEDVRGRVEAAASLATSRGSGMARLGRLLDAQPSAAFARVAMWTAAVPILLAWPVASVLVLHNVFHDTLTSTRAMAMVALPLLLTFGAFLLARGRLTDRFALHAVVVGFGARDPARPGEPYRCRACQADLPDAAQSPVVRCVYCNQANVLGLDLRGAAREAATEHAELETAFAKRTTERWLWRIGSLASLALLAGAALVVRDTLREPPPPPSQFAELQFDATVVKLTGKAPPGATEAARWDAGVGPSPQPDASCRVWVRATIANTTYLYNHAGICTFAAETPVRFSDDKPSDRDGDAMVKLDVHTNTATLNDTRQGRESWSVTLALVPRPQ